MNFLYILLIALTLSAWAEPKKDLFAPKLKSSMLEKKIKPQFEKQFQETPEDKWIKERMVEKKRATEQMKSADPALGKIARPEDVAAWDAIAPIPLAVVPWSLGAIRGMAEVRTPQTADEATNLKSEISYFKSLGYDTALVVWQGERPGELAAVVRELKPLGWKIILTYGLPENDTANAYLDPDKFRQAFALLLPLSDAFLVTWRKSSPAHWSGGAATMTAWCDRVATLARAVQPDIPVLGELFFSPSKRTVIGWTPANVSAVLVSGAGVDTANVAGVFKLCREKTDKPLLALIVGPAAYYNTYGRRAEYPAEYIRTTCDRLEKSYIAAEFAAGTVTLAGDGCGDLWYCGSFFSDSLTKTNWSTQQK